MTYRNVHYLYKLQCEDCKFQFVPPSMRKLGHPFEESEKSVCEDCYDLRMDEEYTNLMDYVQGVVSDG